MLLDLLLLMLFQELYDDFESLFRQDENIQRNFASELALMIILFSKVTLCTKIFLKLVRRETMQCKGWKNNYTPSQ